MPAIRAVIDTSVMLSVAFPRGELALELRNMIADDAFILVTSKDIMAELFRVLHYPRILKQFKPSKEDIEDFVGMIMEKALITRGRYSLQKGSVDPTDDMFLACAMEAAADYIAKEPELQSDECSNHDSPCRSAGSPTSATNASSSEPPARSTSSGPAHAMRPLTITAT